MDRNMLLQNKLTHLHKTSRKFRAEQYWKGGLGGGADFVPVRSSRTRRYERIAGPRWHPSHSREIVIQSVMEIRISEPRAGGRFRPRFWLAVSGPHADRGRCRRGRVATWEAVPPGSCARPSAPS